MSDQLLRIFVAVIFRFDLIFSITDEGFQIQRNVDGAVANAFHLHGLVTHHVVREQHRVPGKHAVALRFHILHQVTVGIDVVFAAATHLFLTRFQEIQHGGVFVEFGIDGQCLDKHAHGVSELFVLTSIINGRKQ